MESGVFDPGTEWTLGSYFLHMRVNRARIRALAAGWIVAGERT